MMEIKDSGQRREFKSGAVRDIGEGKGRCDLLPLDEIYALTNDITYKHINNFIRTGDQESLFEVLNFHIPEREIPKMLLDLAKQYEAGAIKYNERNWEKGIPLHCYIDSAIRHYLKYMQGLKDEDHFIAFIWNIFGALWTQSNRPEMIDLPFSELERNIVGG